MCVEMTGPTAALRYSHTQAAPLYLLILAIGVGMFVGAWFTPEQVGQIILLVSGGFMVLVACCFRQLNVSDRGDQLLISFGPLPLLWRRVQFSEIERVEQGRTTILDGWGVHLSPSGGVTWNLWGFDCVDVWYKKGTKVKKVRIGTDDPEGLELFLKQRMSPENG